MSKDLCLDCGILLSPHTRICPVCGFDNSSQEKPDTAFRTNDPDLLYEESKAFVPENYPGF